MSHTIHQLSHFQHLPYPIMWTNKIFNILVASSCLIYLLRAHLNKQQKQAIHQTMQWIANILLLTTTTIAIILLYKRFFP